MPIPCTARPGARRGRRRWDQAGHHRPRPQRNSSAKHNRFRIALICPLQQLLRRQSQLGEQFSDRRQAKLNAKFSLRSVPSDAVAGTAIVVSDGRRHDGVTTLTRRLPRPSVSRLLISPRQHSVGLRGRANERYGMTKDWLNDAVSTDYADPVRRLLSIGPPDGYDPVDWLDYAAALGLGREHIAALIRLACDAALHRGDPDGDEAWAPMHALRALGQLRAEESVAPILAFIREAGDDEVMAEEVPVVLSLIGVAAISSIAEFLSELPTTASPAIRAMEGLKKIGQRHSACRDECVMILTRVLKQHSHVDRSINGFAIWNLIDLAAIEAMATIRQAFRRNSVDLSIVGDEEDVEIALELRTRRSMPRPDFRIAQPGWLKCSDAEHVLSQTGTTRRTTINIGRNDPCPCGSGKKYKKCCLQ